MPWSDQNLDSRSPPLTLLGNSPTCPAGGARSKRQALTALPGAPGHRVNLRGKDKACSQAPVSLQCSPWQHPVGAGTQGACTMLTLWTWLP